ncbi:YHS domain protein [Sphingobacteriaceae bacterium]|nr:YHS domain protein [Sphingobacteriaceae bacterium]
MKKIFFFFTLVIHNLIVAQTLSTEVRLRVKNFNTDKSGIALQGYDPVNYFLGTAKTGSSAYSYNYNGITYRFVSEKNMALFKASPAKFEPVYGGWCAYAMGATGEKVEVDPETYKIIDGKLYLFYNAFFNNTLPKWNKDEKNLTKKANENWLKLNK